MPKIYIASQCLLLAFPLEFLLTYDENLSEFTQRNVPVVADHRETLHIHHSTDTAVTVKDE